MFNEKRSMRQGCPLTDLLYIPLYHLQCVEIEDLHLMLSQNNLHQGHVGSSYYVMWHHLDGNLPPKNRYVYKEIRGKQISMLYNLSTKWMDTYLLKLRNDKVAFEGLYLGIWWCQMQFYWQHRALKTNICHCQIPN